MLSFFHIFKGIKKYGQIEHFFTSKPVHLDQSEEIFFSPFTIFHSAISWWNRNCVLLYICSRLCTRVIDSSWSLSKPVAHIMVRRNNGVSWRKGRRSFANYSRDHKISSPLLFDCGHFLFAQIPSGWVLRAMGKHGKIPVSGQRGKMRPYP